MQNTLTTPSRFDPSGFTRPAPTPLPSTDLLQGRKTVEISHNGVLYRLQTTKLGKLILTK